MLKEILSNLGIGQSKEESGAVLALAVIRSRNPVPSIRVSSSFDKNLYCREPFLFGIAIILKRIGKRRPTNLAINIILEPSSKRKNRSQTEKSKIA